MHGLIALRYKAENPLMINDLLQGKDAGSSSDSRPTHSTNPCSDNTTGGAACLRVSQDLTGEGWRINDGKPALILIGRFFRDTTKLTGRENYIIRRQNGSKREHLEEKT